MRFWIALVALAAVSCSGGSDGSGAAGVTRVEAGAGLSGGPITSTGTLRVAASGVDGTMIAPASVAMNHLAFDVATQAELDGHDHDGRYAALAHAHDERYAAISHGHVAADVSDLALASVAAMGAKAASNPLHHDRYTDAEAVAAVRTAKVDGTMIAANAVGISHLAFDPATQAELEARLVAYLPIAGGTLGGDLDLGLHGLRNARIGTSTSACDPTTAGMLRFNPLWNALEACDGSAWSALLARAQPFGAGSAFCVGGPGYTLTRKTAADACKALQMRLCTVAELSAYAEAGVESCCQGWTADLDPATWSRTNGIVAYFMGSSERTDVSAPCGGPTGGVRVTVQPHTALASAHCCR